MSRRLRRAGENGKHRLLACGTQSYGQCWVSNSSLNSGLVPVGDVVPPTIEANKRYMKQEEQESIVQIACGSLHTVFLTDNGEAYTVGDNDYGQLGNGTTQCVKYPVRVDGDLLGKKIAFVSVGGWFTLFLTDEGEMYTAGDIHYEPKANASLPCKVPYDGRVGVVGCGNRHLVAQDYDTMAVIGLGSNEQCATGTSARNVTAPLEVYYLDPDTSESLPFSIRLLKIDAGQDFTALLTSEHRILVTGLLPFGTFKQFTYINAPRASDIACSWNDLVVLDFAGNVYVSKSSQLFKMEGIKPCTLIGASAQHILFMERNETIMGTGNSSNYELSVASSSSSGSTALQFNKNVKDLDQYETVTLCGGYFTTMILQRKRTKHEAHLKRKLHNLLTEAKFSDVEFFHL